MGGDFWNDVWQWWLMHGLDGIAGGVLGGALGGFIAWWAVRRTIQHERELDRGNFRRSALRDLQADVATLQVTVAKVIFDPKPLTRERWIEAVAELFIGVLRVEGPARRHARRLSDDLEEARVLFGRVLRDSDAETSRNGNAVLQELQARLFAWTMDPDSLESMPPANWPELAKRPVSEPSSPD